MGQKLPATGLVVVVSDIIRIIVVEAGGAVVFAIARAFLHAFDAQITEAFDAQHLGDFIGSHRACGKFALAREIHPEEAGMCHRRRCDTDMHFERTRVTEHAGKNLERSAAHDGIFDDAHALVLEHTHDGVKLELHLLLAHVLRGVDEGSAHVMVTQQANLETDAASLRIAERRGRRAVGHGNHDVRIDGAFLRELLAHLAAHLVATLFKDDRVRAAEVDVFENAMRLTFLVREAFRMQAAVRDGQEFSRLNIAHIVRSKQVERAGFAGNAPGLPHTRQGKRAEPEPVAGDVHRVLTDEYQAETPVVWKM